MWIADYYEVNPDIMVIGKAMGGGIPVSVAIFSEKIPLPSEEEGESLNTLFLVIILKNCQLIRRKLYLLLKEKVKSNVQRRR